MFVYPYLKLKEEMRGTDTIVRLGGGEFVVVSRPESEVTEV